MSAHLQRAIMLIGQSRYELAEAELQQVLLQDPNHAHGHALRGICLVELDKFNEATDAVATCIQLAPDSAYSFYAASYVSRARNELKQAEAQILRALEMNPEEPVYWAQAASIQVRVKNWKAALKSAEQGLTLDPENVDCSNLRAAALIKLGRNLDAGSTIQTALERAPENARSHTIMGWSLLEQGKPNEAMPHFKEALRLEPNLEWARAGIVESMKSHYWIYRLMLGWFLWTSKLKGQALWAILIGGYLGYRVLVSAAARNPELRPYLIPLIVLYIAFVVMTWVSVPLFNLLLRCNRFGRLVLSEEETRTSTWVGSCLLLAIISVGGYFAAGNENFLQCAMGLALMMPVLATYYRSSLGWPRAAHGLLVIGMLLMASGTMFASIGVMFGPPLKPGFQMILNLLFLPMLLVGIGAQFGVNYLTMATPRKGTNSAFWVWLIGGIGLTVVVLGFLVLILGVFLNLDAITA